MHFLPVPATRAELDTAITRAYDAMMWHRDGNRDTAANYCEQQMNLMIDRRNQADHTSAPLRTGGHVRPRL